MEQEAGRCPAPGLLGRLLGIGVADASVPAVQWAIDRRLPVDRIPDAAGRRRAAPVYPYATVASLDERGLLIENSPRLYRFPFASSGSNAENRNRGLRYNRSGEVNGCE